MNEVVGKIKKTSDAVKFLQIVLDKEVIDNDVFEKFSKNCVKNDVFHQF